MKAFVVRLNPDLRTGLPYSNYPTLKEYRTIHESSPMNGFHEAVNFLSEDGVVRGYLPPKHLLSIRTDEPFILITITAKTAKSGGDMLVGIQVGCRYEGDNIRQGGTKTTRSLEFNWHYSCRDSMSLLLQNQVPNARELVLGKKGVWSRGPTCEISKLVLLRLMKEAQKSLTTKDEKRKFDNISNCLDNNQNYASPKLTCDFEFDLTVADAMEVDLPKKFGNKAPTQIEVRTYQFQRDRFVAAYALKKANGICSDCEHEAPFISARTGFPYLEVHHIKMLKDGGSDTPDNVIALCPNCHRKRHFG